MSSVTPFPSPEMQPARPYPSSLKNYSDPREQSVIRAYDANCTVRAELGIPLLPPPMQSTPEQRDELNRLAAIKQVSAIVGHYGLERVQRWLTNIAAMTQEID